MPLYDIIVKSLLYCDNIVLLVYTDAHYIGKVILSY